MKALLLILVLVFNLCAVEDRRKLMDSISPYAIRIGNGPNKVYAFIDPLCSKSQRFISLISERKDLQVSNSYYIYLYRLEKFESDEYIQYIYQAQDPLSSLINIMLYDDYDTVDDFTLHEATLQKINLIANVAKQLKMKRRPYLLIFDEGSQYCRVSEGTAPCLEENDFDK